MYIYTYIRIKLTTTVIELYNEKLASYFKLTSYKTLIQSLKYEYLKGFYT